MVIVGIVREDFIRQDLFRIGCPHHAAHISAICRARPRRREQHLIDAGRQDIEIPMLLPELTQYIPIKNGGGAAHISLITAQDVQRDGRDAVSLWKQPLRRIVTHHIPDYVLQRLQYHGIQPPCVFQRISIQALLIRLPQPEHMVRDSDGPALFPANRDWDKIDDGKVEEIPFHVPYTRGYHRKKRTAPTVPGW